MTTTYHVQFGRVGRDSRPVPPLTITADDEDELCRAVCEHAMPHLQLDLAASGHPHTKNGHFVWLDLAERGTRFCAARITTQAA